MKEIDSAIGWVDEPVNMLHVMTIFFGSVMFHVA